MTVATKLYVGNLNYRTSDMQLEELFSQAGEVLSATVIMDRETGRSKGFGFVEMADDAAAADAVERFNNSEFDGRTIKVDEARPPRRREGREGRGGGGGYGGGGGGYGGGGGGGSRW